MNEITENETKCIAALIMVKNEELSIKKTFDSLKGYIDIVIVYDTGSTDNTIELIQEFFSNRNIKGKIVNEPFKNFSHNRNFALQACVGMSDYVLLLDADMILKINKFDKRCLSNNDYFYVLLFLTFNSFYNSFFIIYFTEFSYISFLY
jgi:glycosyltransferase involved in cell wall biosynthesis